MNCNSSLLTVINADIVRCQRCDRLRRHCHEVSQNKRRAYREWNYWGKPVPSFGDQNARLLIVGLAPGAHGANRTGRMFTGDRSGDFLYRAMHRAGFASQPESRAANDGLKLNDCWITASAHCAPPDNKPATEELLNCRRFLHREFDALKNLRLVLVLGKIAFDSWCAVLKERKAAPKTKLAGFGHNVLFETSPPLLCSYHPSQQNTSTGRLTESMFDSVFERARGLLGPETHNRTSSV